MHSIDYMFEDYKIPHPHCLSVRRYADFKYMAGSHADMIVESCIQRLQPFCTEEMKNFFSNDELNLSSFGASGTEKTVIFVSAGKSETFDFLAPLIYTQLIDTLCNDLVND